MNLDNNKIVLQRHWPVNIIMETIDISDEDNQEIGRAHV